MKTSLHILLAALAATVALAGCVQEITSPSFENDKVNSEGSRVIAVSFAPQTKTELDGFQPKFVDNDSILISNGVAIDTCEVKVESEVATISTNLTGPLTAVYPYTAAGMSEDNGNEIDTVLVSTVQSGKFADANICMAKMTSENDESLSFDNKTAVFCIYPPAGKDAQHVEVSAEGFDIANCYQTGSAYTSLETIHVATTTADSVWVSILVPEGLTVGSLSFSDGTNVKAIKDERASTAIAAGALYTVTNENWKSPEADIPDGALKGVFSVSADKQVYFSQGNLYAKDEGAAGSPDWKWHFYDEQYKYYSLSTGSLRTAADTDIEIDLFTWGYNATNSVKPIGTEYVSGHDTEGNKQLNPSTGGDDWGVAYCGSNGIDVGTWRTLSTEEWQYLFNRGSYTSEVRNGKYKYGVTVCGKANCVVLLPDVWDETVISLADFASTTVFNDSSNPTWQKMEDAGAVCLPAAGLRDGSDVDIVGNSGYYWSSSAYDSYYAHYVYFNSSTVYPGTSDYRSLGYSVRLVTDVSVAPGPTPVPLPTPSFSTLSGVFTVGAGATSGPDDDVRIHFSQGNLQAFYDGEKYIWTFAANQYDYIGNTSGNRTIDSPAYGDGIDLFGWSTDAASSNWGIHTQTSTQDPDIYTGGNFKDWSGIPDIPGSWRTLSGGNGGEWEYLLEKRGSSTVSGTEDARFLKCKVNDGAREVCGLLLFPDVFTWPSGIDEPNSANINKKELKWTDVAIPVYNTGQFEKLESAGVVFIPAAGGRHGSGVHYAGSSGSYWTSSVSGGSNFANNLFFNTLLILSHNADVRYYGYSVRLVTGVN